uniref:Uncharacterized protein n=1 Tax=Triticum urartu TaxID=4572 RepID=A0A8R7Q9N7_TRIUA
MLYMVCSNRIYIQLLRTIYFSCTRILQRENLFTKLVILILCRQHNCTPP